MSNTFSNWKKLNWSTSGVSPRAFTFNVFVHGIFLFVRCTNICNYAEDTTIFAFHPTRATIIRQLETDGTLVAKWFSDNCWKRNDDKFHPMIFGDKYSKATATIRTSTTDESEYEKLVDKNF